MFGFKVRGTIDDGANGSSVRFALVFFSTNLSFLGWMGEYDTKMIE